MTKSTVYCYSFTGAYETNLCYTILEDGCGISINGTTCNSCETVSCNATTGVEVLEPIAWDCTNASGGAQGSDCEGVYIAPVLEFLLTNCAETNSTNSDNTTAAPSASVHLVRVLCPVRIRLGPMLPL